MARYALIKNNTIQGLAEWDGVSQWTPPDGEQAFLATIPCEVGWTWNDGAPFDPNPPPPPPPPFLIDLSDIDNLDKTFRALGLMIANFTGKTPAQVKAAFLTAYNSLP